MFPLTPAQRKVITDVLAEIDDRTAKMRAVINDSRSDPEPARIQAMALVLVAETFAAVARAMLGVPPDNEGESHGADMGG